MRFNDFCLLGLLSACAALADQAPLAQKAQGWLDKAKAYIPSAAPHIPNPIDAGAARVAQAKVEKINIRNFERKLQPKLDGEEEWLIYLTGGNESCYGRCDHADLTWNESVPLLVAQPRYQDSTLKLGMLNCEIEKVLCTATAASVPAIFHFILPQRSSASAQPLSPMRDIMLNLSTVAVSDITSIPRSGNSRYLEYTEYTGALHPIDGTLTKLGLLKPLGYALWGIGTTPSWMFMIGISFFSRQIMARRATRRPGFDNLPRVPAPGAAAPRPAAKKRN